MELRQKIDASVEAIRNSCDCIPDIGIILGTGLGSLGEKIEGAKQIAYESIPYFPVSTVDSHAGQLILGTLAGRRVVG